jgi:ankyrin repeat protein
MFNLNEYLKNLSTLPSFYGIKDINPCSIGSFSERPIHIAAIQGNIDAIDALYKFGVDINIKGEHGYTPLHEAIEQGNIEVVMFLIKIGANPYVKNDDNLSPIEMAEILENNEIVKEMVLKINKNIY